MSIFSFKLSEHTEKEIEQSLSLVRQSFGDVDVASREYYEWQYLKNPAGPANLMIASCGNEPAGQFACIPCRYKFMAKEIVVPLTLNLCVSPRFRGRGLMSQLISSMHQFLKKNASFSIGVPNQASISGHIKNGYLALQIPILIRPVKPSLYFSSILLRSVINPFNIIWKKDFKDPNILIRDSQFDHHFDKFENEHSRGRTLIQIRNATYLNWRYHLIPTRKYITLTYYEGDHLHGYLIIRLSDIRGKRLGIISELVTSSQEIGKKLSLAALQYCWENGTTFAISSTFPGSHEFLAFKRAGFFILPHRFRPHPLALCVKIFSINSSETSRLSNPSSWFFTLGDNDAL